jgi:hypothetical protein
MDQFVKLCGDADGCTLTMGVTGIRPINSTETLTVPVIGPPCHFFYSPVNKQWTISESCIAILGMYKPKSDNSGYEFDSVYQGYVYGNVYGVDDSEVNGVDPDKAPLYVIGFKTACYLAESAPDTRANGQGKLMPDVEDGTGKGLFLIASDPSWESANFKLSTWDLSDPNRQCVLIVDD